MENKQNNLMRDLGIIVFSIIVAILLIKTGAIEELLKRTQDLWFLGSFIAGMFLLLFLLPLLPLPHSARLPNHLNRCFP